MFQREMRDLVEEGKEQKVKERVSLREGRVGHHLLRRHLQ